MTPEQWYGLVIQQENDVFRATQGMPTEWDQHLNGITRRKIHWYAKVHGGACYIIKINRYKHTEPWFRPYAPGDMVYNFGGSHIVPTKDAELERLLQEREDAPYTGGNVDMGRITAIFDRVKELGGEALHWV